MTNTKVNANSIRISTNGGGTPRNGAIPGYKLIVTIAGKKKVVDTFRHNGLVLTALKGGVQMDELNRMKGKNVFRNHTTAGKTDKDLDKLRKRLNQYFEEQGIAVCSNTGSPRPKAYEAVSEWIDDLEEEDIPVHALRHRNRCYA